MMIGFHKKKGEDLSSAILVLKTLTLESHDLDLALYLTAENAVNEQNDIGVLTLSDLEKDYDMATEEEFLEFLKSQSDSADCCGGTDPNCQGCGEGCSCSQ